MWRVMKAPVNVCVVECWPGEHHCGRIDRGPSIPHGERVRCAVWYRTRKLTDRPVLKDSDASFAGAETQKRSAWRHNHSHGSCRSSSTWGFNAWHLRRWRMQFRNPDERRRQSGRPARLRCSALETSREKSVSPLSSPIDLLQEPL